MRYIKLKVKENDTIVSISKETEKAVQIKIETFRRGKLEDTSFEWLPKSAIFLEKDWLIIEDWLAREKGLFFSGTICCDLSDVELLQKKGWKLTQLTSSQRIELLEEGLAHLE